MKHATFFRRHFATLVPAGLAITMTALSPTLPAWAQDDSTPLLDRISSSPIPATEKIIVPGDPPLTQAMINRYSNFIEWLFETPFNQAQRQYIDSMLKRDWRKGDKQAIQNAIGTLELEAQLSKYDPQQREFLHQKLLPEVLKEARKETDNPDNQWILGLYDATHKPIAPGNPPLTRQASDAFAEMLCFMITETTGKQVASDARFKSEWAKTMATQYPKMPAATQQAVSQLPAHWAGLQIAWPNMSDADKEQARAGWRKQLQAFIPATPRLTPAEANAHAYLNNIVAKSQKGETLTQQERQMAAKKSDILAKAARQAGGAEKLKEAAEWDTIAKAFRKPLPAPSAERRMSSNEAYSRAMNNLQSSHNAYVGMSNMLMMNHVTTMNAISAMSSGPSYTYSVRRY